MIEPLRRHEWRDVEFKEARRSVPLDADETALNEPVRLTDSLGASATVWFREMAGASCVFDYRYTG